MKKYLKLTLVFGAMVFAHNAAAYNPGKVDEVCKKPKFSSFSLSEYTKTKTEEVPAESAFSFAISNWIDPTTIKLMAKKKALPFTVQNKNSFFLVNAKIPAEYSGQFVRIDVLANARLGCKGLDGWLVKVAAKPSAAATPPAANPPEAATAPAETPPAAANPPVAAGSPEIK